MDVVQACLTVFSPVSLGCEEEIAVSLSLVTVCLAVVISLPGICAGLCSLHCPQFPLDMVKGTLLFVVVGCDFGHAVSLKHRALGHPVEILASGSKLLSCEPGRGLHLEERHSFFQISCPKPLSPQGQA